MSHDALYDIYQADRIALDPGDGETIYVREDLKVTEVVTTAAQTRTLAAPLKSGVRHTVVLKTDGGDLTLTVTGGYNGDGDTVIVFDNAGEMVIFESIDVNGTLRWQAIFHEGTDAALEVLAVDTATITDLTATTLDATTGDIPTLTVNTVAVDAEAAEHGAGAIGTAVAPATHRYSVNGTIITEIKVDLTGLDASGTENDVIGLSTGGAAYLGRYVVATCGIVYRVEMSCLEVPLSGDADVILVGGSAADEAFDDTVANTVAVCDGTGDWTLGETIVNNAPAGLVANYYLYLTQGASDDATYTAGQFLIRLYGHPVLS